LSFFLLMIFFFHCRYLNIIIFCNIRNWHLNYSWVMFFTSYLENFLRSKVYFKKAQKDATQSTHDVYRKPLIHIEKKNTNQKKSDIVVNVTLHINKVCSTNFFKLSKPISQSSKLCAFYFFHRHHIKHKWVILQICTNKRLPICPLQLPNNSLIVRGITHSTPNSCNNVLHNSVATLQCRNKWSMDSPQVLYI